MSDKKEIATLSIKISVDSTDLDKLEAQLKRIAGLMVHAGLKEPEPASVGFSADMFFVKNGQTFIDSAFITSATVSPTIKYTISGLHSDEYKEDLKQAVKQAIRPVIRQHIKVERVNEKQTETDAAETLEQLNEAFSKSTEGSAMTQVIRFNTAVGDAGFEEYKQQIEANYNEIQSQLTSIQCGLTTSEQSTAQHISGLQRQITQLSNELEEARLKGSVNAISIISLKQTIEQQKKSLTESIMKTIVSDLGRGGNLSRML